MSILFIYCRYSYYYAAAHPTLKHHLGFKKYITLYQILQFNILLIQIGVFMPKPCIDFGHRVLAVIAACFLLYMNYEFTKFFIRNYVKTGKQTKAK